MVADRVGDLVGHDKSHHVLVGAGRDERVEEQRRLAVVHQTPVLHGAGAEVWHRHVIWTQPGTKAQGQEAWAWVTSRWSRVWRGVPDLNMIAEKLALAGCIVYRRGF